MHDSSAVGTEWTLLEDGNDAVNQGSVVSNFDDDFLSRTPALFWVVAALVRGISDAGATVSGNYLSNRYDMSVVQPMLLWGVLNLSIPLTMAVVSPVQRKHVFRSLDMLFGPFFLPNRRDDTPKWKNVFHLYLSALSLDVSWVIFMVTIVFSESTSDAWVISIITQLLTSIPFVYWYFGEKPTLVLSAGNFGVILGAFLICQPTFHKNRAHNELALLIVLCMLDGFIDNTSFVSTQHLRNEYSPWVFGYSRLVLSGLIYLLISSVWLGLLYPHSWVSLTVSHEIGFMWFTNGMIYSLTAVLSPLSCLKLGTQMMGILTQSSLVFALLMNWNLFNRDVDRIMQYFGLVIAMGSIVSKPLCDYLFPQGTLELNEQTATRGTASETELTAV